MDTTFTFLFLTSSVNLFLTELILRKQKFKLDGLVLHKSLSTRSTTLPFFILWLVLSISFASVEAFQVTSRKAEIFLENKLAPFSLR